MTENTQTTASKTTRAKSTKPAAEKTAIPNFDAFAMPNVEIPGAAREFAEKSIEQARDAYAKVKTAAEEATDLLEDTFQTTRRGAIDFNAKALDAAKANSDATFQFVKDLMGAKTVAEAIELQSSFARNQFETFTAQAKDMQEFSTKFAGELSAPMKDAMEKSLKTFKAA